MALLLIGVLLWSATHLMPSVSPGTKVGLVGRLGEGGYKGLTTFFYSEGTEEGRDFRAVVVATDAPPAPDPVSPTAVEDLASAS